MQLTTEFGLKVMPFGLHHDMKPRTKLTKLVKDNGGYLSDWTTANISLTQKQVLFYVGLNEKGDVPNHILMAWEKNNLSVC